CLNDWGFTLTDDLSNCSKLTFLYKSRCFIRFTYKRINKIHKIVKITLMIVTINGICITKSSILPLTKISINTPNRTADAATPYLFIDQFSGVFIRFIVSASSTLYTGKGKNQYKNGNKIFQKDGLISKI